MPTIDELASKYGSETPAVPAVSADQSAIDALASKYGSAEYPDFASYSSDETKGALSSVGAGLKQGANDVINSVAGGIGFVDKTLSKSGAERNKDFENRTKASNEDYEAKYGKDAGADVGRFVGQTAATLPLVPAKAVQAVNVGMRALPTVLATGERVAAPLINRLGAAAGSGAVGGGVFGAAISASNEDSLTTNIGRGIITGALAGPVVMAAGSGASALANATKSGWEFVNIDKLARSSGLSTSAVKDVIARLDDAGLTPITAQTELTKLGPKATLLDLSDSLAAEGGALVANGGKQKSIIESRLGARAETANSDAVKIFENKYGPKPDVNVEGGKLKGEEANNIHSEAQRLTGPDYKLAHKSTDTLDAKPIVSNIDDSLDGAVGSQASKLQEAKGYLFKTVKDPITGEESTVLKSGIQDLHKVRIGLDEMLGRLPSEGSSQASATYRSIKNVRSEVDELLKTNPQMKTADEKFAEKMEVKEGLKIGFNAIKKGMNKEEFAKTFDDASPEVKETIKKGMRAAIGDAMERSSTGELTGAQKLFDKKSLNRSNFKKAFGIDAEDTLNAVHQEVSFRNTERSVLYNSKTAERQAIQARRAGEATSGNSFLGEALKGIAIDASTGSLGAATAVNVTKTGGRNMLLNMSEGRLNRLNEGSADILSRSGTERDNALSVLSRVTRVQEKSALSKNKSNARLPLTLHTLPVALGEDFYKRSQSK